MISATQEGEARITGAQQLKTSLSSVVRLELNK